VLVVDVSKIPPEGLDVSEALSPEALALPGGDFVLRPGASLQCHLDLADEATVHAAGRLGAQLEIECGRCLEPFVLSLDQRLELFFLPHRKGDEQEDEVELTERDMVVAYYREGRVDLGESVREQLILAVPMKRLCREDCRGLCRSCGQNRNLQPCECVAEPTDPRLESLARLLK
jgi:uncharacterized protein